MSPPGSVLITGCSDGGSGSALASVFQQHGYLVFATAPDVKKMTKLETLDNVKLLALDVCSSQQIREVVEFVSKETGGSLDYLINCAARNRYMPILDEDIEEAKKNYDTNVWGPLAMTKAFSPLLIKAEGTFVFVTSVAGHLNTPYQGIYAAAKKSEEIIADTLRLELVPLNVKVLCVVTGALDTNIQTHFKDFKLPNGSFYTAIESTIRERANGNDGAKRMDPAAYANAVVKDILKGKTGKVWHGWSAGTVKWTTSFLPTSLMDKGVVIGTGLDILAMPIQ